MKKSYNIGNDYAMKYKDEESLKKGIDAYFKKCDKNKDPYTMTGLALTLGIDRSTLVRYSDREMFATLIKDAKRKVENQMEQNALKGKANSVFTIFSLKNNYGWTDEQKVEAKVQGEGILGELVKAMNDVKKS